MQDRRKLVACRSSLIAWTPCRASPTTPRRAPSKTVEQTATPSTPRRVAWDRSITAEDVKAEVKHRLTEKEYGKVVVGTGCTGVHGCKQQGNRYPDPGGLTVQLQLIQQDEGIQVLSRRQRVGSRLRQQGACTRSHEEGSKGKIQARAAKRWQRQGPYFTACAMARTTGTPRSDHEAPVAPEALNLLA